MTRLLLQAALVAGFASAAVASEPVFKLPRDNDPSMEVQESFNDGSVWVELKNVSDSPYLYMFEVRDGDKKPVPKDQWRSNFSSIKDKDEVELPPNMPIAQRFIVQWKNDGVYYLCLKGKKLDEDLTGVLMKFNTRKCRKVVVRKKELNND